MGQQIEQDEKDVKIARFLHHDLTELQLQGHQKLKNQVLQIQNKKRAMQSTMRSTLLLIMDEENQSHLEDLEMRLKARQQTNRHFQRVLVTVVLESAEEASYDSSGGKNSTYVSEMMVGRS